MPDGELEWDLDLLAAALRLDKDSTRDYFTDGRRVSFILERRIAAEVLAGKLAPSEGDEFDLIDAEGNRWEVRSISSGGIYFCPSYMVGSGRAFEETGFLAKLDKIAGYVVCDIEMFPKIPYWKIEAATVRTWWSCKKLGKNSKISRAKALSLLKELDGKASAAV